MLETGVEPNLALSCRWESAQRLRASEQAGLWRCHSIGTGARVEYSYSQQG